MTELRGWMQLGLRFSALGLLGVLTAGCPGNNGTGTPTGGSAGTSNTGGSSGGAGGTGGMGGSGGSSCVPETEICDGKDNDCNDKVDDVTGGCACNDGATQSCYSGPQGTDGVGECKAGTQTCVNGQWADCMDQVTPADETCNSNDDDCDGEVDEGLPDLTCGVGECAATAPACVNGVEGTCTPGQPSQEVCDGKDNNCNQLTDEADPQVNMNCTTNLPGACAAGKYQCNAGVLSCVGAMPTGEMCDGIDNDCNGATDDNIPGTGGMCSTGAPGVCSEGLIGCQNIGGIYSVDCYSIVPPSMDVCDGLDNNCDGATDEGDPGGGAVCDTGALGICAPGVEHCVAGAITCVADNVAATESCNGIDDNCNGAVDDGNPGGGVSCPTGVPGLCATGTTNCQNGQVVCTQTVFGTNEVCNSIDDDCDGVVDDGNPGGGAACSTGLLGVCAAGTINCTNGQLLCQQTTQASGEICGNAFDENCDGIAQPAPTTYFSETFANNNAGWTLGPEWAIGPAVASNCGSLGQDPGTDHTPTADNGLAGVIIGGCYPTTLHADYCLTSPAINTTVAAGNVFLSYWRHLHTDYPNYISSHVDVSANNGSTWTTVYSVPSGQFQQDTNWTLYSHNVTAQKSTQFRVRFCYSAGPNTGIISAGGWSVDDVALTDVVCQ